MDELTEINIPPLNFDTITLELLRTSNEINQIVSSFEDETELMMINLEKLLKGE